MVYRHNKHWIPLPFGHRASFIRAGPFERQGEKQLFLVLRGNQPVGRLSVHRSFAHNRVHGENQGFFGFFEALDDQDAVRVLFDHGAAWLAARGCTSMLGPMSFTIYDEIGLLIDAFDIDPSLLCPYNPRYYARLLEDVGFRKEIDWYSYLAPPTFIPPQRAQRISDRLLARPGVHLRPVRLRGLDQDTETIRKIFNAAWSHNWGHVPIDAEQWAYFIQHLMKAVREDLCLILTVQGRPVAAEITLLDLNQTLKAARGRLFPLGFLQILLGKRRIKKTRMIMLGVLPEYRKRGLEIPLILEAARRMAADGLGPCDCSQVVENNSGIIRDMEALGLRRYKTHRIYRKILT